MHVVHVYYWMHRQDIPSSVCRMNTRANSLYIVSSSMFPIIIIKLRKKKRIFGRSVDDEADRCNTSETIMQATNRWLGMHWRTDNDCSTFLRCCWSLSASHTLYIINVYIGSEIADKVKVQCDMWLAHIEHKWSFHFKFMEHHFRMFELCLTSMNRRFDGEMASKRVNRLNPLHYIRRKSIDNWNTPHLITRYEHAPSISRYSDAWTWQCSAELKKPQQIVLEVEKEQLCVCLLYRVEQKKISWLHLNL